MCKPPPSHEGQHIDTCFNSLEIQSVICNNSGLHHHKAQWLALCKFYSMRVHKQTFLWTPLHTCTWRQCSFVKTFCRNSFCSLLCNGFDNLFGPERSTWFTKHLPGRRHLFISQIAGVAATPSAGLAKHTSQGVSITLRFRLSHCHCWHAFFTFPDFLGSTSSSDLKNKVCNVFLGWVFSWGSCSLSSSILVMRGMVAIDAKLQPKKNHPDIKASS